MGISPSIETKYGSLGFTSELATVTPDDVGVYHEGLQAVISLYGPEDVELMLRGSLEELRTFLSSALQALADAAGEAA